MAPTPPHLPLLRHRVHLLPRVRRHHPHHRILITGEVASIRVHSFASGSSINPVHSPRMDSYQRT